MSAEQTGIAPEALSLGFVARVDEYVTSRQFNTLATNLEREGVIAALGDTAIDTPWQAFMEVTDGITAATAESGADPALMNVAITFTDTKARERFHNLYDLLLAGIHGLAMPHLRSGGPRELRAWNFSYADLSTAGRAGTALLRQEYGKTLGPNLRLIQANTVGDIASGNVMHYIPDRLRTRVAQQREDLSQLFDEETADESLLSSGRLGIVGKAMREAQHSVGMVSLAVQRPRSNRPRIEEKTHFFARGADIPLSHTTIRRTIIEQVRDGVEELTRPYKERNLVKVGQDLWDIVTGLGMAQGAGSAVRALGTISAASVAALWGMRTDQRRRKHNRLLSSFGL
ncbi:MAG TPA: hypothetical protein VJR27_03290 [Candidatus Saccharimonadales bacterium]|nr:hypothetical protein [Candidatus Saccharimonadales bacterium]